jgi:hypothetical protein
LAARVCCFSRRLTCAAASSYEFASSRGRSARVLATRGQLAHVHQSVHVRRRSARARRSLSSRASVSGQSAGVRPAVSSRTCAGQLTSATSRLSGVTLNASFRGDLKVCCAGIHRVAGAYRSFFESRKSRRNGPWLLSPCGHSPFSFLVSLSVSLVLCDTAAGGVEAAVLARLHHVALPLVGVSTPKLGVELAAAVGAVATGGHKSGCLQLSQLFC